jgi:hypothetical protein
MSHGFPSHSCADEILSHGEVVEVGDRFPAFVLVSCRDHKPGGDRIRCARESKALWRAMRVGRSIVVPGSDGGRLG